MRATQLNKICIMTFAAILTVGFEASASLDPNMEAGVACADTDCMFAGMPQISNEPVARMQRLVVSNNTEAKLMNINRYEDNAA
ncbi:MAG: hypothetical protein EOP05_01465, partial [Proteobacteria bacterium]